MMNLLDLALGSLYSRGPKGKVVSRAVGGGDGDRQGLGLASSAPRTCVLRHRRRGRGVAAVLPVTLTAARQAAGGHEAGWGRSPVGRQEGMGMQSVVGAASPGAEGPGKG